MQCDAECSGYSPCVSACPLDSCDNLMDPQKQARLCNTETCVEGCKRRECPAGSVYSNTSYVECVPKTLCKPICLVESGIVYYEGDVMTNDSCHICKCSRGSRICSGEPCAMASGPVDVIQFSFILEQLKNSSHKLFLLLHHITASSLHFWLDVLAQPGHARPLDRR